MNLFLKLIITLLVAFSPLASFSQCAIKGNMVDSLKTPLPFIPVGLLNFNDSSIYKGLITNEDGNYCFENIKKGSYIIKILAVGYNTFYTNKIDYDSITSITLPIITLNSKGINLNEIAIVTQKKIVEFKNGNITVNVEGTALASGNTAYDLLARLPGVSVTDDNISIQGKGGVRILIDNKLQQLSGTQLLNLLKSINASQIEKMEVLKKPPVKYDAAGTGGMINIITKKIKLVGFSGSFFSSYSQGFYGNPNGGFNLNYKGKKFNFFSGITANKDYKRQTFTENRIITYDTLVTTINQVFTQKQHGHYETFTIGTDWFIDKKNSIGIKASGAFGFGNEDRTSTTTLSDNSNGYRALQYTFTSPNPWIYPDFNFNAEHLFDTTTTTLRFSVDYNPYYDLYTSNLNHHFFDVNFNEILTPNIFKTTNTLNFSILSSKLDFEKQFKKSLKLETGIKQSYQSMLSDYTFKNFNNSTNQYENNSIYTNIFSYNENISAAYINLNKEYKKFFMQAGLRGENTIINAQSKTNSVSYTRQYFNVFPMLSVEYKKSDKHNFQLSANRRINRPDYNSFNPYQQFKNILYSHIGNPYLRPEYSNSVDFTYSYKTIIYNTFSFSRINNVMLGYATQTDSSKVSIGSTTNLKYVDVLSYNLFFQKEIKKWWLLNINANVYSIQGNGIVNNLPYVISTIGFNPSIFSRFVLPQKYTLELNTFYLAPVLEGVNHVKNRSAVNIAIKKSMLEDKLSISLALNDIFFTNIFSSYSKYQNQNTVSTFKYDTRRINISINYNFGKLKVQQREIKSNTDEKNRAGH